MTEIAMQENALSIDDLEKHSGLGVEDSPPAPVPQFKILHGTEAEISDKKHFLFGKKAGGIYHTEVDYITGKLSFHVCYIGRAWLEWETKEVSKTPPINSFAVKPTNMHWVDGSGNITEHGTFITENRSVYVLVKTDKGLFLPGVIQLNKTAIKQSNEILKILRQYFQDEKTGRQFIPPAWLYEINAHTETETKDAFAWKAWRFTKGLRQMSASSNFYNVAYETYMHAKSHFNSLLTYGAKGFEDVSQTKDSMPF